MFGLPRPWYFPFQKSYWLGNGRVETWEWTWPWSRTTRLSIMEEDQACAMESRRLGEGSWEWQWVAQGCPWLCHRVLPWPWTSVLFSGQGTGPSIVASLGLPLWRGRGKIGEKKGRDHQPA